ncbi:transposase [Streptococcus sanguinis]|uniref:transposase n=1 Tax=Streptococcus sanguinis TaxID=1305 RepID=UPI0015A109A6|nr:transposase [Streptococcus sanguinis]
MHIHYNTNQTTLPLEISSFLPQDHLVFTIEKVVNALEDTHFHAFYHAFGRPSYHPKMLLATLLFAYSQGIFAQRKIDVEPVFGQIKACLGYKRCNLRGKRQVKIDMGLVLMANNLLKYNKRTVQH